MPFTSIEGRYDGPRLEREILEFWRSENVFDRSLRQSEGQPLYSWYEGPPTANGKPGIHHVLARAFKDLFPRYKTMNGFHCPRKAGWDAHGLPVEHEVEKELGIFDKSRIESEIGIEDFNRRCRESVSAYIGDWAVMTERMGFWVNLDDAYATLENDYIESVWSLIKTIWDKGLIYRGYKIVPYDPRIGTTLSSHEVSLGYREVEDPSVWVRFPLQSEEKTSFLVWTTTPWTLPANLALAVNAEVEYAYVRVDGEVLILAKPLLETALGSADYEVEKLVRGSDLEGQQYHRPFPYLEVDDGLNRVHCAQFVSVDDGTGIVHIAPAYGEDDLSLGQEKGLPVMHAVGEDGRFLPEITPVAGKFFKDADPVLIDLLRERGLLFRSASYTHNYPFGWRTGDPIIYYAKHAWYIRTTEVRDRMMQLNRTIQWVPENIRDGRFGKWLENNVDWALSRERFWGTPLPVWTDGEGDYMAIGSIGELRKLSGLPLQNVDLHRPAIDEVTFVHPDNGKTYRRVPEVIDCWFDSGSMPYAQWHYPFEHREAFAASFPADFICEAIDQTRGWFYTLHAIATMVSDSVAYRNCICLSHVVDEDGKKMSKSKGNIVDPYDVFDEVGADALRWYFVVRTAPEAQKRVSVRIVRDVASTFINTLWNTFAFFLLYTRLDKVDFSKPVALEKRPQIDRWIVALTHQTIETVTTALDNYDAKQAGEAIESLVDQLSNWYVRRNRQRFWKAAAGEDKQAAYLTLFECLDALQRLIAPFMPFLADALYQNMRELTTGESLSIHLTDWPVSDSSKRNDQLVSEMDIVQKVVKLGRAARNDSKIKVRQPLARILVRVPDEAAAAAVERHGDHLLSELNVKAMALVAQDAQLIEYRVQPNLPRLGKRYGKHIPAIRAALKRADAGGIAASVARGEQLKLDVNGQSLLLEPEDVLLETTSAEGYACAEEGGYLVGLDTRLDDGLLREGLARELIRTVQDARKKEGLEVSDNIALHIDGNGAIRSALDEHRDLLMAETLAIQWGVEGSVGEYSHEHGGNTWTIRLARVQRDSDRQ